MSENLAAADAVDQAGQQPSTARVGAVRALRVGLGVQLVVFAVQSIIGMVVNLDVTIPDVHPGSASKGGSYFGNLGAVLGWSMGAGPGLAAHVGLALVLIVVALVLVWLALASRDAVASTMVVLAALCSIGAAFNGGSFLINGNHDTLSSLMMEILFTVAAACYIVALVRVVRVKR
jgi:hypothetical protein